MCASCVFRSCLAERFIPAGDFFVQHEPWSSSSRHLPLLVRGCDWRDGGLTKSFGKKKMKNTCGEPKGKRKH